MNVLLQTAGQDAPPTGQGKMPRLLGRVRCPVYPVGTDKQRGMSQNGKLNSPRRSGFSFDFANSAVIEYQRCVSIKFQSGI